MLERGFGRQPIGAICFVALLAFVEGCLPTVVIVDRPSVIEEESAGEWLDIEQELSLLRPRIEPAFQLRNRSGVTRSQSPGRDESSLPATGLLPTGQRQDKDKALP